ncbi:MAG TPA: hypothetical protein VGC26_04850 [Afipia sp.]
MTNDRFKGGVYIANDTANPKATSVPQLMTKSFNPKPGATVQPKAPLAPAETGQQKPPSPKHD